MLAGARYAVMLKSVAETSGVVTVTDTSCLPTRDGSTVDVAVPCTTPVLSRKTDTPITTSVREVRNSTVMGTTASPSCTWAGAAIRPSASAACEGGLSSECGDSIATWSLAITPSNVLSVHETVLTSTPYSKTSDAVIRM